MIRSTTLVVAIGAIASIAAAATPTIEYLPPGFLVTDMSRDGSVMCGNVQGDGSYETFRWTAATGVVRLGAATVPVIGTGAGSPDISYDGTRISATIISESGFGTQGIWRDGAWIETMPPLPPDCASLDSYYATAWGLSGDGSTLTGFYYLAVNGRANPSTWSQATGSVGLPHTFGMNSRVDAANYDGSVVCGWVDSGGPWNATVWRNGVQITLANDGSGSQANAVNASGDVVVGMSRDASIATIVATIWRWDGAAYQRQFVGRILGTVPNSGTARLEGVSDDAQIAGGVNYYTLNPGGAADGIVWTASLGMLKDTDYFAAIGLAPPTGMDVRDLGTISPDGHTIAGYGLRTSDFLFQTFIIHLDPADLNYDGVVNATDLALLLGSWGACGAGSCPADFNGDGVVGAADLAALLGSWG